MPTPKPHALITTTPDPPAPQLFCPECARLLVYRQTALNGIDPPERWDYFECALCGPFAYRTRTRKLRKVDALPLPLLRRPFPEM